MIARGILVLALALLAGTAAAQDDPAKGYPAKPIRIYVGFTAGGGTDFIARVIADKMFEGAGRSAIIENKPGASGIIAAETTLRTAPDGYGLMFAPAGVMTVNPAVYTKLSYSPERDFIPISLTATFPLILAVNNALPVKNVAELVAWAKANPTKANQGGSGQAFQLVAYLFRKQTGAVFEYLQYKSTSESTAALIAGEIIMSMVDAGPLSGAIKNGQVRGLAVSSPQRMAAFPNLPTMAEQGFKDLDVELWAGMFAPAGTPAPIIQKLEAELIRVATLPDVKERLRSHEVEPVGSTGPEFARRIASETARYTAIARENNIKIAQ
ncbi:MAG TPA: tripartite tricarboxylate transporter substrate binding protein [Alphaproteobacteria bacterium]